MDEPVAVQCPWCGERIELYVDPDTRGSMVEDCAVCCRPWQVHVERDDEGEPRVSVARG